jgi:hypothetical protein
MAAQTESLSKSLEEAFLQNIPSAFLFSKENTNSYFNL